MVGTQLGPYQIVARLGEGGMGAVYRARDTRLKRDVAIKVLLPEVANDPERLARFQREAEVLATLNHPNIAHIYGLESQESQEGRDGRDGREGLVGPFLVLELVEGLTLAERIAASNGRGLLLDEALPIAKQIAEALEAAHEHGIIHRDLKPANIKVKDDGTVKVLDFGLAKASERSGMPGGPGKPGVSGESGRAGLHALTQSPTLTSPALMTGVGMLLGSAAYMSPEQAKGKPADKRADIWAFGCVLYEMLTGRRAFAGDDVTDTIVAVISKQPDLTVLPSDTPAAIRRLLRRCFEKDIHHRLGDASAARLEIQDAQTPPSSIDSSQVRPHARRWMQAVPWALLAAATAALIFMTLRRTPPPSSTAAPVMRLPIPLPAGQDFTRTGQHGVGVSPDGTRIAYVANGRIYLRSMTDTEAKLVPGIERTDLWGPTFSPDGQSIAFYKPGAQAIQRISIGGGSPVTIAASAGVDTISWTSSGIIYSEDGRRIQRVQPGGGMPETLINAGANEQVAGGQLLPDGDTLLFTLATASNRLDQWDDRSSIVWQSLRTGERTTLAKGGVEPHYVASSSTSGYLVYARSGVLMAQPAVLNPLRVSGSPAPVVEGVRRGAPTAHFSVSDTGLLAYIPGPVESAATGRDLALIDRQGKVRPLDLPKNSYNFPRVSPDGRRITFQTDDGKEAIVWTYDLAGDSPVRRLTFGGNNRYPLWSGDGTHIVFQSDREGDRGLFWQPADGSGNAERLTKAESGAAHVPDSWPPRGDRLSYGIWKDGYSSLWVYALSTRKSEPVGDVQTLGFLNSAFSSDGRWLAYNVARCGRVLEAGGLFSPGDCTSVYVQPYPPTGARYEIARKGFNPFWTRDGKTLIYSTDAASPFEAVQVTTQPTFQFTKAVSIPKGGMNGVAGATRNFDVTADDMQVIGTVEGTSLVSGARIAQIDLIINWFEDLKAKTAVTAR